MNLLIDLGNTRLKWALSGRARWLSGVVTHRGMDMNTLLDGVWAGVVAPARIIMTSVATDVVSDAVELWTQTHWGSVPHRVRARREQLGVVNRYRDPATLGADRWAALIGARGTTQRACAVVDCGTAVTVDALSADGVFAGGVIIPGLRLLRESLGAGTAGIGFADGEHASCLAQATADGVAAGALYGLAGAIERCVREQERGLGETLEILLTGGDGALLAPVLERPLTHAPELVLKGLARVAESLT
jgi:type III pantothenate kinase